MSTARASSRKVTVAATQFACSRDADANIARAESLVREAATRGAQVTQNPLTPSR